MAVILLFSYSPDFSPCDSFLFPSMKSQPKVWHFQDTSEIQEKSVTIVHVIAKVSCSKAPAVAETLDPLHKLGRRLLLSQ
jgi:hypothetical protein